ETSLPTSRAKAAARSGSEEPTCKATIHHVRSSCAGRSAIKEHRIGKIKAFIWSNPHPRKPCQPHYEHNHNRSLRIIVTIAYDIDDAGGDETRLAGGARG